MLAFFAPGAAGASTEGSDSVGGTEEFAWLGCTGICLFVCWLLWYVSRMFVRSGHDAVQYVEEEEVSDAQQVRSRGVGDDAVERRERERERGEWTGWELAA